MSHAKTKKIVKDALIEDLEGLKIKNDASSQLIPKSKQVKANINTSEAGILAGVEPTSLAFKLLDETVSLNWHSKDGDEISPEQPICEIEGEIKSILAAERTALNFLSHLSGIATLTAEFVKKAEGKTTITDTRKTTPGLRHLEKAAVLAGGGTNHRFSLADAILIKDNHLAYIGIADAVASARAKYPKLVVEVECDTLSQVEEATNANADAVLLDNMALEQIAQAIEIIRTKNPDCPIEASGDINIDTIAKYADTGVDYISIGALTKSSSALDMSLDII